MKPTANRTLQTIQKLHLQPEHSRTVRTKASQCRLSSTYIVQINTRTFCSSTALGAWRLLKKSGYRTKHITNQSARSLSDKSIQDNDHVSSNCIVNIASKSVNTCHSQQTCNLIYRATNYAAVYMSLYNPKINL
jgi:hypothetical protein